MIAFMSSSVENTRHHLDEMFQICSMVSFVKIYSFNAVLISVTCLQDHVRVWKTSNLFLLNNFCQKLTIQTLKSCGVDSTHLLHPAWSEKSVTTFPKNSQDLKAGWGWRVDLVILPSEKTCFLFRKRFRWSFFTYTFPHVAMWHV